MVTRSRPLVVIPTYNEADSILLILRKLYHLSVDVLVVDDNSPDGTAEIVKSYSQSNGGVSLLLRTKKSGLGSAYREGFLKSRLDAYPWVIQMDADGSHQVSDLERMLNFLNRHPEVDLLIGSRWIENGQTVGWSKKRLVLSRMANLIAKVSLHSSVKDLTAGFKVLSSDAVDFLLDQNIETKGYGFQIESTILLERADYNILEIPITFIERAAGRSKMHGTIILEAILLLLKLGLGRRHFSNI